MVDKIWKIKNKFLERMEKEVNERGIERVDVAEMDKLANIVHHFAEAEASCWQAEYYKTVTKAMEQGSSGYGGGTGSSAGYGSSMNMGGGRSGYDMPSGYDMARAGYKGEQGGQDAIEMLRKQIQEAGPDDRERLRHQAMTIIGAF